MKEKKVKMTVFSDRVSLVANSQNPPWIDGYRLSRPSISSQGLFQRELPRCAQLSLTALLARTFFFFKKRNSSFILPKIQLVTFTKEKEKKKPNGRETIVSCVARFSLSLLDKRHLQLLQRIFYFVVFLACAKQPCWEADRRRLPRSCSTEQRREKKRERERERKHRQLYKDENFPSTLDSPARSDTRGSRHYTFAF